MPVPAYGARRRSRLFENVPSSSREFRLLIDTIPITTVEEDAFGADATDVDDLPEIIQSRRRRRLREGGSAALGDDAWTGQPGYRPVLYRKKKVDKVSEPLDGTTGVGVIAWSLVQETISQILGPKGSREDPQLWRQDVAEDEEEDQESFDPDDSTSKARMLGRKRTTNASSSLPITIPHGLQQTRAITYPKAQVKNALFLPSGGFAQPRGASTSGLPAAASTPDVFVVLDDQGVTVWRGAVRIRREEWSWVKSGVVGWCWVEKRRCFVVAVGDMTIRVLDHHYEELSVVSNSKPILFIDFVAEKNELVTGEVGTIKFWTLAYSTNHRRDIYTPTPRLVIEDLLEEEWVSFIVYDRTSDRCFAAVDSSVYIYDWTTGERLQTLKYIHDMSITCFVFYEAGDILITGSKDGKIKVWTSQFLLLHTFSHNAAITALLLIEKGAVAAWASTPIVMSSSLDGTIRMWDFDMGSCVYRVNLGAGSSQSDGSAGGSGAGNDSQAGGGAGAGALTGSSTTSGGGGGQGSSETISGGIFGMHWMRKDCFWLWSRKGVSIWSLNRYHSTFTYLRTRPIFIRRLTHPTYPSRILAACQDGSIKLMSPASGLVLVTAFPVYKDVRISDLVGDAAGKRVYTFMTNGDIVVYDVSVNPGVILGIWEDVAPRDKVSCITGIDLYNHPNQANAFRRPFYLGFGAEGGGIGWIADGGRQEGGVQAHIAEVTHIVFNATNLQVISAGRDFTIKVWQLTTPSPNVLHLSHKASIATPYHVPAQIGLAPERNAIGLHLNGGVTSWSCKTDGLAKGNWGEGIADIAWCSHWGIWVTAERGGVVRVWDQIGLLREIQFNEPILSLCFANARGDLLVSLNDQISLVRMHDYLPHSFLRKALECDFADDPIELPLPFDSNIDFWEGVYERDISNKKDVGSWHMKKKPENNRYKIVAPNHETDTSTPMSAMERNAMAERRRAHRLFIQQEQRAFRGARRFESLSKGRAKSPHDDLKEDENDPDLMLVHHFVSEEDLVDIIRPSSPTEGVDGELILEHALSEALIQVRKRPIKSADRPRSSRRRQDNILRAPQQPRGELSREAITAQRALIRRKLQAAGVAMPNSSLAQEVHKGRRPSFMAKRAKPVESPTTPKPTGKYQMPVRARGQRKKVEDPFKDFEAQRRNVAIGDLFKVQEELYEQDRIMAGVEDDDESSKGVPPEILPPPPSPPLFEPEVIERPKRKRKAPAKKKKVTKIQAPKALTIDYVPPPPPAMIQRTIVERPPPQPVSPPKVEPKVTDTAPKPLVPTVISIPQKPKPPAPPAEPKKPSRPPSAAEPKEKAVAPPKPRPKPKSKVESVPVPLEPEPWFVQYEDVKVETSPTLSRHDSEEVLPLMEPVEQKEAAAFSWNLIRAREFSGEEIPDELRRLMGMFWFPQLKGKQVTLTNIVAALLQLLKSGLWLEKVEASKALLFLYHTFSHDFLDPLAVLIRPQLECLWDENWQVRAQLCQYVTQYKIPHLEVLTGLIGRLSDENEQVRVVALSCLTTLGIRNIEDLKKVMMDCGMITASTPPGADIALTQMLATLEHKQQLSWETHEWDISRWLCTLPNLTHTFEQLHDLPISKIPAAAPAAGIDLRRNSYIEHLAGPFFPPDAHGWRLSQGGETAEARAGRLEMLSNARQTKGITAEDIAYMDVDDGVKHGWDTKQPQNIWTLTNPKSATPTKHPVAPSKKEYRLPACVLERQLKIQQENLRPKRVSLHSAQLGIRPLTAGSRLAKVGFKGVLMAVKPALKIPKADLTRPRTAPVYGEAPVTLKSRTVQSAGGAGHSINAPWSAHLRTTFPPVDVELHDRPFRA